MEIIKKIKKHYRPIRQIFQIYRYRFIPVSYHFSDLFWKTYNFLEKSQWWSRDRLIEYQFSELQKVLQHSYNNIPYYRNLFQERDISPNDIKNLNDIRKIPTLNKNTLIKNLNDMVAKNVKIESCNKASTSGSSGKPFQFYHSKEEVQREQAFVYHQWHRVGVRPGDPMVQIRGAVTKNNKEPTYSQNYNALVFSPQIKDHELAAHYLQKIEKYGALYIHGYPSAIANFAYIIKKYGLHVPFKLSAVLFASESVYEWERKITEVVFGCKTFDFYGQAEHCCISAECEVTRNYHFVPQYGITEIDSATNEIIGTGFLNYVTPFIRYRTGDIASKYDKVCCDKCKRNYYPIAKSIEGRLEDYLITPEGIPISPAVITHPFKDFKTIKATQIVQETIDLINVNIVPWEDAKPENLEVESGELRQGLSNLVGPDVKIDIHVVDDIPLLKSGKFKWIKSNVSKDSLLKGLK